MVLDGNRMVFTHSSELRAENLVPESDMPELCVLFGALRSGTTMLRLMIDGHPRLICPGETDFLTDFLFPAPNGGWRYDLEALSEDRIFQDSRAELPDTAVAGTAFQSMVANLRGEDPGCLFLVMHRGLGRLLDLLPDVRIIHLVRDPRDVARSAIGMGWAGHVYYGADIWLQCEKEWERNAPRLAEDQSLELRYETLVQHPEAVLSDICGFVGERFDLGMLKYSEGSTYDPPDPSLVEQWRKRLSAHDLGLIEMRLGDLLARRGYERSGHRPIAPGPAERFALWIANKRSVWRHRITRFGLRDPLIVGFAHRVGLPRLAAPARRRIDNITRSHLK